MLSSFLTPPAASPNKDTTYANQLTIPTTGVFISESCTNDLVQCRKGCRRIRPVLFTNIFPEGPGHKEKILSLCDNFLPLFACDCSRFVLLIAPMWYKITNSSALHHLYQGSRD
jgi:hypothetical protein